jgi:hypothetical protein
MAYYGQWETWKVVYLPKKDIMDGTRGVALVEAGDRHHAMQTFREQYSGQYVTIQSCEKLFG